MKKGHRFHVPELHLVQNFIVLDNIRSALYAEKV